MVALPLRLPFTDSTTLDKDILTFRLPYLKTPVIWAGSARISTDITIKVMQLRIKCEVQSEVILQRRMEFNSDDRTYAFEIDPKGIWNSLTVLATFPLKIRKTGADASAVKN
jgi:hypothetical protein